MAEQGNLFTSSDGKTTAVQPVQQRIPRWLASVELALFVVLRLFVGVGVFLMPWAIVWTRNAWINHWPTVANFIAQGWIRGIVSGLGLLNIWIALSALVRRKPRY